MATKATVKPKKKAAKSGNKGQFTAETAKTRGKVPGPGRTAGYKTWSAEIYAYMLESPASKKDERPFAIAAMEKYKQKVLSGSTGALLDFMSGMQSFGIENLDAVLAGQKNQDKALMRFRVYETLFDEQMAVYNCKKGTQVIVCGRRAGKTHEMAADGLSVAMSHDQGDILYLGATHKSVFSIIWPVVIEYLKLLRIPYKALLSDQIIELPSGVKMYFAGYHNRADIEKQRGHKWRRVYIDEASICPHLKYLKEEIIEPALADYNGILKIYGTPPRVKGTFFEHLWNEAATNKNMARFNWDMSVNVHMPDYVKILDKIRDERGWKETDQVYQREYLGRMGVYDEDALVYRLAAGNFFTDAELAEWVKSQPPSDLYFTAGLDFGFSDSDAFGIILGSRKRPESFLVYEYKKSGTGVSELADAIRAGFAYIKKTFPTIPQNCYIFADTGGGGAKDGAELARTYSLLIMPAIKQNKDIGISLLQDEVKRGFLKVRKDGAFANEAQFIVFKRNEADDSLTREIDEDIYHGDMSDAVLYAKRPIFQAGMNKK